MSSKYAHWSPYNFVGNSPTNYFDPDGMERDIFGNVTFMGAASMGEGGFITGHSTYETHFNDYFDKNGNHIRSGGSGSEIRILENPDDKLSDSKSLEERPVSTKAVGKIGKHYLREIGADPSIPVQGLRGNTVIQYMGITNRDGTPSKSEGIYNVFKDPVISIAINEVSFRIDFLLHNRNNFMSTLYHETVHFNSIARGTKGTFIGPLNDASDLGRANHLNVYWAQMNHWTYSSTTEKYKNNTTSSIRSYYNQLQRSNLKEFYGRMFGFRKKGS